MQVKSGDYVIGIDIGGTKCAVVLGDLNFNIQKKIKFDTGTGKAYMTILEKFKKIITEMIEEIQPAKICQIGISCGGPLDSKKGMIHSPPNLPGWDDVPIVEIFENWFGIPTAIQNDANACALAEWLMGAGKGYENMVFLTFGTGMGAGLILNGKLYAGTNDLGGEVGHVRLEKDGPIGFGKEGSFEGFCSGGGIAQLARSVVQSSYLEGIRVGFCEEGEMDMLDARKVAIAANEGDETALGIIKISAEHLGKGLAILIDILNPQCIVIGSIYSRNEKLFRPHVDRILELEAIPSAVEVCEIKPALLGDSIGDYAALCVALNEIKL